MYIFPLDSTKLQHICSETFTLNCRGDQSLTKSHIVLALLRNTQQNNGTLSYFVRYNTYTYTRVLTYSGRVTTRLSNSPQTTHQRPYVLGD